MDSLLRRVSHPVAECGLYVGKVYGSRVAVTSEMFTVVPPLDLLLYCFQCLDKSTEYIHFLIVRCSIRLGGDGEAVPCCQSAPFLVCGIFYCFLRSCTTSVRVALYHA